MVLIYLAIFLFGASIGSFAYAFAFRYPVGRPWVTARSHCEQCGHVLAWYELLPLVSFLIQRGGCRECKRFIGWGYFFVEFLSGLAFVLLWKSIEPDSAGLFLFWFFWSAVITTLIIIFGSDMKHLIIPDAITLVLLSLAVISKFFSVDSLVRLFPYQTQIWGDIATAAIWAGALFGIWLLSKGKWLGFGDVKLAAVLGLMFGFPGALWIFYIAVAGGLAISVFHLSRRKINLKTPVPLGSFLSFSAIIYIIFAPYIDSFFLGLLL